MIEIGLIFDCGQPFIFLAIVPACLERVVYGFKATSALVDSYQVLLESLRFNSLVGETSRG